MNIAEKLFGIKENYQLSYSMGRFAAEEAFGKGLYKMLLERGRPQTIIRRAPMAWRMIHSMGNLEIETLKENSAKLKITNFDEVEKCFCWRLIGYFQRILEISGVKNVQLREIQCRTEGAEYCEFEAKWEYS